MIEHRGHFPGRERDEKEVLGYYAALERVEQLAAAARGLVTEKDLQTLHAMVMSGGSKRIKPTPYRDGQSVIRDARSRKIVYLPPEAKDVSGLMSDLLGWLKTPKPPELPFPIRTAGRPGCSRPGFFTWAATGPKASIRWRSITRAISAHTTTP